MKSLLFLLMSLIPLSTGMGQPDPAPDLSSNPRPESARGRGGLPAIFIASDSTAAKSSGENHQGWGVPFASYFDPSKVSVVNRARGGRSSRTFITEGLWSELLEDVQAGDLVLIQFGHNDGGAINREPPGSDRPLRARGSLPGLGPETEEIDNAVTGQHEIVRTYGWYMEKMIDEAKAKGALPIVVSLTARNIWSEGQLERGSGLYGRWASDVAREKGVAFIDLTELMVEKLEPLGPEAVAALYPRDHTHFSAKGADLHAAMIVAGLKGLKPSPVEGWLSAKGREIEPVSSGFRAGGSIKEPIRFAFVDGAAGEEAIRVEPEVDYSPKLGYGFDLGTAPSEEGNPYYFSVLARDGNYKVTVTFGGEEASSNTVKAESRRLMLEKVDTEPGETATRTFVVNVRDDRLEPPERYAPGGNRVALNDREIGVLHCDDKLTLEFNGSAPRVQAVEIVEVDRPTVYLIGDSTVTDQPEEPAASWGQMLPRFFDEHVAVANHAESGETMKSFLSGLRLAKVLETLGEGDYLFIQFAHNDQKKQWPQTYVEAGTTYKAYLKVLIAEARRRGATPVLVTSMQRRMWDDHGRIRDTLGEYPEAMREVAKEEKVALIDLERMSVDLYEALGEEKAPLAFSAGGKDATHHNNYGAYQLAQCVVEGIREAGLPLAKRIVDSFGSYDPKHPDDPDTFHIAPSPNWTDVKPLGD